MCNNCFGHWKQLSIRSSESPNDLLMGRETIILTQIYNFLNNDFWQSFIMLQSTPGNISHPGTLKKYPYRAAKPSSLYASVTPGFSHPFVSIHENTLVFIKIVFCRLDIKAAKQLEFIKLPLLERNISHLTVLLAIELSSWLIF